MVEIVNGENAGFYFCGQHWLSACGWDLGEHRNWIRERCELFWSRARQRVAEIDGSLEGMQKTVSGYIQAVYPFEETVCLVCNEEGKLQDSMNRIAQDEDNRIYDIVAGNFLCAIAVRRTSRV